MRFMHRTRAIAGFGILLLVSSFTMVGVTKANELSDLAPKISAKAKMGGISTVCHLERIKNIPDLKGQAQAFDRLFNRYRRAKQDSLVLQLIKGMDKKQFPQLQADEMMEVAYHHLKSEESETAIPLLSQAFQLLQSSNDDDDDLLSNYYQHFWQSGIYHQDKANLLKKLGMTLIDLKQLKQAEAALLQGLQTNQKYPSQWLREKVEYTVEIAKGFLALGKREQAIALLDKSLEVTQSLNHTKASRDDYKSQDWVILLSKLSWEYRLAGQTSKANLLFSQSLEFANSLSNPDDRIMVLSSIAESTYLPPSDSNLAKERHAKLEQILGKILQIVRSTNNGKTSSNTGWMAAEWFKFLGIESATQFFNTVADPVERVESISQMLRMLNSRRSEITQKDIDLLVPLLTKAEASVRKIQKPNDRDRVWSVIAVTYFHLGQLPKALEAIAQIQSTEEKQYALIVVAIYLAQAGQPDLALSLVKDLPDTLVEPVLFNAILAYLTNEQLETALGLQGRLSKNYPNPIVTSDLARISAKVGRTTQALILLKQISETDRRSDAIISIVGQAIKVGDLDLAVVFAQQMSESKVADYPSKSWMLEEIVIAYAESGQYDKAFQLSQSLPDRSLSQLATCAKRSH